MSGRLRVVMTTEGTYPYYAGGVSTWADILVKSLHEIDFSLLPVMMHPYISAKFVLPPNVTAMVNVPLWGTEEPTEYMPGHPFHKIYRRKLKTSDAVVENEFRWIIEMITRAIYCETPDLRAVGESMADFHDFFREYDYHTAFRSRKLWDFFYDMMLELYRHQEKEPSLYNIVENLRWLYRFFISLLSPVIEADIYHSSAAAFCGLPCIVAKIKRGAKFLLTEHGVYVREQYLYCSRERMPLQTKEFLLGLIRLVSKLNYYYADQVSPVCAHNMRWEKKFGTPEEKIRVIYNGIDEGRFTRMSVDRSGRPTVVMVARIEPLKDIETFIRTCALVRETDGNVLFKLYGPVVDQDYYERCSALVRDLGLGGHFVFSGPTASPEISNNEGDVVLLTSISEAFPFAVLEGMACEKVVISSDVGGTKEVLEGYGFIVRPRDHRAFAEKVRYVLTHPEEAAEMGLEARQRVLSGFRVEDMVRNYRDSYFALAGRDGTGR